MNTSSLYLKIMFNFRNFQGEDRHYQGILYELRERAHTFFRSHLQTRESHQGMSFSLWLDVLWGADM